MNERKNIPELRPEAESEDPPRNPARPETRLVMREVSALSPGELMELKQYLDRQRINIRQSLLQKGVVSIGYAKFGVIELGDGRIAFIPNQNNEKIVGTPLEFLQALKTLD